MHIGQSLAAAGRSPPNALRLTGEAPLLARKQHSCHGGLASESKERPRPEETD